ncbi:DUF6064 family protein [Guyparkeria sp.]|uniref:DUF6064 family protein n=1 Tax=Guyparkeria sp. TaxID=2035736 RepID=UPI003970613C
METWLSYRPADLLMFSPEIYVRLFERLNLAAWPVQILLPALAAGIVLLANSRHPHAHRLAATGLAAAWGLAAWWFFPLYAEINLAAPWLATLFAAQSLLLLLVAAGPGLRLDRRSGTWWPGLALLLWGMALHPLAGLATGRDVAGAELFALAPDPTAIATLGIVLMAHDPGRWRLAILPLAWCAISAATWWSLLSQGT